MFTMNSPHTIAELGGILGVVTAARVRPLQLDIAMSEEALAFVRSLQKKFPRGATRVADKKRLGEELAKSSPEELRRIARRIMVDLLRPPLRLDPEPDGGQRQRSKQLKSAGSRADAGKRKKK
jgi:hypothetical protein